MLDFVEAVRRLGRPGRHHPARDGRRRLRRNLAGPAARRHGARGRPGTTSGCCRRPTPAPPVSTCESRGYDGDVVRRFRLGWAPDGLGRPQPGARALRAPRSPATGLGFVNRRGRRQDAFRGRIIFPICDPSGRPIALGGRILPPGRAGRSRRRGAQVQELPGDPHLRQAPHPLRAQLGQAGGRGARARSSCARATPTSSGSSRPACSEPSPPAGPPWPRSTSGCSATSATGSCSPTTPTRRGRRPPPGSTSGSAATRSTWPWPPCRRAPTRASWPRDRPRGAGRGGAERPSRFLQFRLDRILAGGRLSARAEGRAKAAEAAHRGHRRAPRRPGPRPVRDAGLGLLPARARLVRRRLEEVRRQAPGRPAPSPWPGRAGEHSTGPGRSSPGTAATPAAAAVTPRVGRPTARPSFRPGLEALRLAIHRPEAGRATGWRRCFSATTCSDAAFQALVEAESLHEAIDGAPPDVADLLRRVAVEEPVVPDDGPADPVDAVVTQLVRVATRRALADLQVRARTAPDELATTAEETARCGRWLEELDDPFRSAARPTRPVASVASRQGSGGLMAGRAPRDWTHDSGQASPRRTDVRRAAGLGVDARRCSKR